MPGKKKPKTRLLPCGLCDAAKTLEALRSLPWLELVGIDSAQGDVSRAKDVVRLADLLDKAQALADRLNLRHCHERVVDRDGNEVDYDDL